MIFSGPDWLAEYSTHPSLTVQHSATAVCLQDCSKGHIPRMSFCGWEQVRGLEHVSWLSLVGTLGMMTAMGVACAKLLLMVPPASPDSGALAARRHPPSDPELRHGFYAILVALMDIVFAYGGQQNWVGACLPCFWPCMASGRPCSAFEWRCAMVMARGIVIA